MVGKIFSIEEFSTFDGPGIRMSVFLKGCPLRCSWCHNPEGQQRESQYIRKNGDCIHCGQCIKHAEQCGERKRLTEQSAAACPKSLIRLCGQDYQTEELCGIILKNSRILSMNGGGVTFSGGEPLLQFEFLLSCLEALRPKVHCAIQTCGYASASNFKQILSCCHYVLFDLKLIDNEQHKKFCGTDNGCIIENYRTLAQSGLPFITRVPLIPGVTDTVENITAIARLMHSLSVDNVELLPYNKMAGGKYGGLLEEYTPDFDEAAEPQPHFEIFEGFHISAKQM